MRTIVFPPGVKTIRIHCPNPGCNGEIVAERLAMDTFDRQLLCSSCGSREFYRFQFEDNDIGKNIRTTTDSNGTIWAETLDGRKARLVEIDGTASWVAETLPVGYSLMVVWPTDLKRNTNLNWESEKCSYNAESYPHLCDVHTVFIDTSNTYEVLIGEIMNGISHLRVRRVDREPISGFDMLMQIKNDLAGEDSVAIEVYPKAADLVNNSNTRHLWCFPPGEHPEYVPNLKGLYEYNIP